MRAGLAVVSVGAAAIHFAMAGDHLREHVLFGAFFVVVAWLQALWAVGIVAVPSPRLLTAGTVGNLVVVAVWIVSRTWGIPFGPTPGRPEAASSVDLAATALEVVIAVGCTFVVRTEARGARSPVTGPTAVATATGLAGLAVAMVTLAISAAPGHDHDPSAHGAPHDDASHHHVVSGTGEADPAQIEAIRTALARYENVDVARAEGWEQEHPDWPEIGAHFTRATDQPASPEAGSHLDPTRPDYLMYSRLGREHWQLVAVAYVVDQAHSPEPPTELHGAAYHQHRWSCVVDGEELDDEDVGTLSRDDCRARHGEWSPGGVWMTHVWLIDNPSGPFAEANPDLV